MRTQALAQRSMHQLSRAHACSGCTQRSPGRSGAVMWKVSWGLGTAVIPRGQHCRTDCFWGCKWWQDEHTTSWVQRWMFEWKYCASSKSDYFLWSGLCSSHLTNAVKPRLCGSETSGTSHGCSYRYVVSSVSYRDLVGKQEIFGWIWTQVRALCRWPIQLVCRSETTNSLVESLN